MVTTVLSSADLVEAVTTGKVPMPPEVKADNEAQAAKKEGKKIEAAAVEEPKAAPATARGVPKDELAALDNPDDPDNQPGEDGLSPREKRIFTKSMQATISRKFRAQKEAEALATAEYNRSRLAEERAERLERENAALKRQQPAAAAETVSDNAPPARENFQTDAEFQDALIDYRVDQKLKARQEADAKARDEAAQAEAIAAANARVTKAREIVPDFDETLSAADMAVPSHIASYMQSSDLFAELGYHFAKNPQLLSQLTKMTEGLRPGTAAYSQAISRSLVALGKIEGTLQPFAPAANNGAEPTTTLNGIEPSKTGTAPSKPRIQAPIVTPLSAGTASVSKPESEMSYAEVREAWERKNGVKLAARKRH